MIVTFCGHRDFIKNESYEKKMLAVFEKYIGEEMVTFYLGENGNFDAFAYECAHKYKTKHPESSLVFITPYFTVEYQQKHLAFQKNKYDAIVFPEIEKAPPRFAISYRNKWMIEKADLVVAYITHDWGGAYQSYRHAKRKGKKIENLAEWEEK